MQLYEYFKPGLTQIVLATGKATCPRLPVSQARSSAFTSLFLFSFILHICPASSSSLRFCPSPALCYPLRHRARVFSSSTPFTVSHLLPTLSHSRSMLRYRTYAFPIFLLSLLRLSPGSTSLSLSRRLSTPAVFPSLSTSPALERQARRSIVQKHERTSLPVIHQSSSRDRGECVLAKRPDPAIIRS